MNLRRMGMFKALAALVGAGRAQTVADGWRKALQDRPDLVADVAALGFLDEAPVRYRQGRPTPLPNDELQYRAGAGAVSRAILDRAGITHDELMRALEEISDAPETLD